MTSGCPRHLRMKRSTAALAGSARRRTSRSCTPPADWNATDAVSSRIRSAASALYSGGRAVRQRTDGVACTEGKPSHLLVALLHWQRCCVHVSVTRLDCAATRASLAPLAVPTGSKQGAQPQQSATAHTVCVVLAVNSALCCGRACCRDRQHNAPRACPRLGRRWRRERRVPVGQRTGSALLVHTAAVTRTAELTHAYQQRRRAHQAL